VPRVGASSNSPKSKKLGRPATFMAQGSIGSRAAAKVSGYEHQY
jgi:hypothetical protein